MMHLMIDLETLGTGPRAPIVQIGAVWFATNPFQEICSFERRITLTDMSKYEVDYATLCWWMKQSEEARSSVFSENALPLSDALDQFLSMCYDYVDDEDYFSENPLIDETEYVWANSPSFDLVVLKHAILAEGVDVSLPWSYSKERDYRTLMDVAEIGKAERPKPEIAHSAYHDALAQAKGVSMAYQKLSGYPEIGVEE